MLWLTKQSKCTHDKLYISLADTLLPLPPNFPQTTEALVAKLMLLALISNRERIKSR